MTEETRMILDQLQSMDQKIGQMDQKVGQMDQKIDQLTEEVSDLRTDVNGLKEDVSILKENDKKREQELKLIQLTIENELNRNIQLIAEGHLDLDRKLTEALGVKAERELIKVRLNMMESELRLLKAQIG